MQTLRTAIAQAQGEQSAEVILNRKGAGEV
jgi:hypothetical protein